MKFWNGDYAQFVCDGIDFTQGLVSICEGNDWYEYSEEDIKELIFVNGYTLSYAIDQGYEP